MFFVPLRLGFAPLSEILQAARTAGSGIFCLVGSVVLTPAAERERSSLQLSAKSASGTDSARQDQMIACTISIPRVSQPVTPITKRPPMNTSATASLRVAH